MQAGRLHTKRGNRKQPQSPGEAYQGYVKHKWLVMVALVVLVIGVALVSIKVGSTNLSYSDIIAALFGAGDSYNQIVVWNLRMPRILTACIGGIALALAGCAFQSVLRNPLASASTLGISQGAAFGASIAIIVLGAGSTVAHEGAGYSANPYLTVICAFAGAMLSTLVILGLTRFKEMSPESIVLAGVALSALFTGGTTLVQYFAEDSQVAAVIFWTFGDLGRTSYKELAVMGSVTLVSGIFFFVNRWNYNAMESGETSAHNLGINVQAVRIVSMVVASLAAATVIAFCGIINFVGLVAPHIMRRFLGADYRYLLPASALAGAGILLISDIIAHTVVAPQILPISAITAFVGAPVFIYLLFKGVRH